MTNTKISVSTNPGGEYESENENMSDWKKLALYLAFTFGLSFPWFYMVLSIGEICYCMSTAMQIAVHLGMLYPFMSHIKIKNLTEGRIVMAGKDSLMLGISLKNGKWKYYLLAILLPFIYTELGNSLSLLFDPGAYDPVYYKSIGLDKRILMIIPLDAIVTGMIGSFGALGEEGGWRGYMMPKLFRIMGRGKALITGGIIWGLWHAPLTCIGHNFGTDYFGFPWLGILRMCVLCILLGILLTFVTEKTQSIWPAAFMHAINNASPSILNEFINPDKANSHIMLSGKFLALLLIDIVVLVLWKREDAACQAACPTEE